MPVARPTPKMIRNIFHSALEHRFLLNSGLGGFLAHRGISNYTVTLYLECQEVSRRNESNWTAQWHNELHQQFLPLVYISRWSPELRLQNGYTGYCEIQPLAMEMCDATAMKGGTNKWHKQPRNVPMCVSANIEKSKTWAFVHDMRAESWEGPRFARPQ